MSVVPVVCLMTGHGTEISSALQRSGVVSPIVNVGAKTSIPSGDAYVVVDQPGLPVTRYMFERANEPGLFERVITFAPQVPASDMTRLERIGIRYYCNSNTGLDQLFKLIGQIKADILLQGRERAAEAEAVAASVFRSTADTLQTFPDQSHYDADFYRDLMSSFEEKVRNTSLFLLIAAISRNQDTTIQHCATVTTLASAFATQLGFNGHDIERVFLAAFFHDIGKSAIPKAVIDKPDRLTDQEMQLMRTHATVGHMLLRRFPATAGEIAEVALSHHEYLDGTGYPQGLRGSEIPDLVRIITIADIYAALIERRAYKPPFPPDKAFAILEEMGSKLDQDLVGLFEPVAEQVGVLR